MESYAVIGRGLLCGHVVEAIRAKLEFKRHLVLLNVIIISVSLVKIYHIIADVTQRFVKMEKNRHLPPEIIIRASSIIVTKQS